MRETLPARNTFREPRNPQERGAINIIFAVFIAVALAFLFSTVMPLMNSEDGAPEVLSALHASDRQVLTLTSDGTPMLYPLGESKLNAALVRIEKQANGRVTGDFCAGIYRAVGTSLQTALEFKDAFGRSCADPLAAVQAKVILQVEALGASVTKMHPYLVLLYKKYSEHFIVQPAIVLENASGAAVIPVPNQVVGGAGGSATATPAPTAANTPTSLPTAPPTPTQAPVATSTVSLGSQGGNNSNPVVSATEELGGAGVFQF